MVSINGTFGSNRLNGIGGLKGNQETTPDDKPKTLIDELQVYRENDKGDLVKIYDDGKRDVQVVLDKNGNIISFATGLE